MRMRVMDSSSHQMVSNKTLNSSTTSPSAPSHSKSSIGMHRPICKQIGVGYEGHDLKYE